MNIFDKLIRGVSPSTELESQKLASELAAALPADHHIALSGNLGAGKTTFVKGLAKEWQIKEPVTSPTYSIYTIYQGSRMLIHIDAYKLETAAAFEDLMLEEFAHSPCHLVVEWPENVEEALPQPFIWLELEVDKSNRHSIRLIEAKSRLP